MENASKMKIYSSGGDSVLQPLVDRCPRPSGWSAKTSRNWRKEKKQQEPQKMNAHIPFRKSKRTT